MYGKRLEHDNLPMWHMNETIGHHYGDVKVVFNSSCGIGTKTEYTWTVTWQDNQHSL